MRKREREREEEEEKEEKREEEEKEEDVRVLEKLLSVSYLTLMVSECGRGGREKFV